MEITKIETTDSEAIPGNSCGWGYESEIEDEPEADALFLVTEKFDGGWKILATEKTFARALDRIRGCFVEHVNDETSEYIGRDGKTYRVITL